jgi:hypothetical protein
VRAWLRTSLVAAVLLVAAAAPARSTSEGDGDLAPDLKALKADELQLEFLGGGIRNLRFGTNAANFGSGPLELEPVADDCDGDGDFENDRTALQRIYHDDDGDGRFTRGTDVTWRTQRAGCFFFHDIHDHWHFEDFAAYRLHEFNEDGSIGPPIRASEKVSFCMLDALRAKRRNVPGMPKLRFYKGGCDGDTISGISVGWADRYGPGTQGQHIDITGVPDGDYCLAMISDPSDRFEELDEEKNSSQIRITLTSDSVTWFPYRRC